MVERDDKGVEQFQGKEFPCPVCGFGLSIRLSRKGKPYCVCDPCGIQLFFRGQAGIDRLAELVEGEMLVCANKPGANMAVALYNQLQRLGAQRKQLEEKKGLIFTDGDLENAILIVDSEIERARTKLQRFTKGMRKQKKK